MEILDQLTIFFAEPCKKENIMEILSINIISYELTVRSTHAPVEETEATCREIKQ